MRKAAFDSYIISTSYWLYLTSLATIVVCLVLSTPTPSSAVLHRVDYINNNTESEVRATGHIVEQAHQAKTSGDDSTALGPTGFVQGIEFILDFFSRGFSIVSLQPVNNSNASGGGTNINNDGSCVVGYQDSGFGTPFHALRWTQATGPVALGTLDPQNNSSRSSFAIDTNQDCSVIVGFSDVTANGATQHAFRWTPSGMVDLGAPANGGPNSRAFGVSSAGTVIVGDADFPDPNNLISGKSRKAFRWTQAGGFQSVGELQPAGLSIATTVTGDGTVVVGQASTNSGSSAFRWVVPTPPAQAVMQPIGPLPGHTHAVATGVSDNGKIVVGTSSSFPLTRDNLRFNNGTGAFRWTQAAGLQDLRQVLIDNGVDLTGITLVSVTGMSRDGQWIQGAATTPQTAVNQTVAFVAQVCDDDIGGPCSTTGGGTAPFTLGAAPSQLTVPAGQSGSTTITVTPDAGFAQPVSFSCGGLPQGAACSFNPATATPNGGPVNTTLTISTNGGAVALLFPNSSIAMFAYALTPFVILPVGLLLRHHGSHGRLFDMAVGLVAALTLVGMLSCSGSDSTPPANNSGGSPPATGTPAGTSNVTVTASSGNGSSNVPVTLTVTRP